MNTKIKRMLMMSKETPWYLKGNIPKANCIAAYKPKGALNYLASKVNLANPGIYDLMDGASHPSWSADVGWIFVAASLQYLIINSAIITSEPITMICRFNADNVTNTYALMAICDTAAANRYWLRISGATAGDPVTACVNDTVPVSIICHTTTGYIESTWYTGALVTIADNNTSSFINGGGKNTDFYPCNPSGLDTTYIGVNHTGVALQLYYSGKIAACAFYNIALSDAQVLALHNAMMAL